MSRWDRRDTVAAAVLWIAAAGVYLAAVAAAPGVLTGEEASVSLRDVLFTVEQRTQASVWSTNTAAPLYYWAGSHLDPAFGPLSGRRWKAAAMALVGPLVYLTARTRLGCGRGPAALAGALVVLLPGVSMFGWVATENGLEVLPVLAGLVLATSRRWWPVAPLLGGVAVATHPSGLAWAAAIGCAVVAAAVRDNRPARYAVGALGSAVGVALPLLPLWWWTAGPEEILVGGGRVDGTGGDFRSLWSMLTANGSSYYYFSELPALGSGALTVAALAAVVVAVWRRPAVWPWLLVAAATLVLWVPAGNLPGVRRTIALAVVAAIVLGVLADVVATRLPARWGGGVVAVAALLLIGPVAVDDVGWWRTAPDRILPVDWPAPPGGFATLDTALRAGLVDPQALAARTGDSRAVAIVWLLADRSGPGTAGLPAPGLIARLPSTPDQVGGGR